MFQWILKNIKTLGLRMPGKGRVQVTNGARPGNRLSLLEIAGVEGWGSRIVFLITSSRFWTLS